MGENILTPGEKIKNIRKDFKIKQSEITGGKITRNLISLIENNKAELTNSTAKIISDCVNNICREKNIDFKMTPEDLLINNTMQAHRILDNLINEVTNNIDNISYDFSSIINNSEKLIKQNPCLDKIVDFYLKLGDAFLKRNDYWQAYVFLFKAYEHLDLQKQKSLLPDVTVRLSYTCNNLLKYPETIQIVNTMLSLNLDISSLLKYKLILNKALAQKNLKQYLNAINSLHELNQESLDDANTFNIKTLEANCYKELKLYKNALDIHFELYSGNYKKEPTKNLIILCNIINTYMCMNNIKEVKKYLNIATKLLNNPSLKLHKHYSMSIYYDIGNSYVYIEDYNNAIWAFTKTLEESKENKFYNFEFKSMNSLFSIYSKRGDYTKLEELKFYLIELLNKDNRPEYHTLIYKYINMYSMQNKKDDLDSLVSFALSLNREEFND